MARAKMDTVVRHLRRAVLRQDAAGRTDGQLLASFIDQRDEAAFEALVRRHGTMVFGVCRRVVGNHHDAEDAFQATFLVLARKAASVRPRERLANWLHGVALRTAMKAKTMTAKRQGREKQVTEMPEPEAAQQGQWRDLRLLLDQELNGLPENYRLPILLCDLESKTIKEATQQLGWPQGTLAGRLARARKMLAKRLTQRGVVLSGGALAVVLSEKAASACVPVSLAVSTTKAAIAVAAGQAAAPSLVSANVAALMEGVMKGMMLTKIKSVTVALIMLGLVAFGGSMALQPTAAVQQVNAQEGKQPAVPKTGTVPKTENRPRSLDEQKLHGEWICQNEKSGRFILIFGPGKTVRRIKEDDHDDTGTYSVDWSKNPHHLDLKLISGQPAMQAIMEFLEPGGILRIDGSVGEDGARPKEFTDETVMLTRTKKHKAGSEIADQAARADLRIAAFYRRTGKFSSAYFYYKLVRYRYPGSDFAEQAKQGIEDLNKHRIRLPDGSEGWATPEQPERPQPSPMKPTNLDFGIQQVPKAEQEVSEIRQQVKVLENRLAALEQKGKPQLPAKTGREAPTYGQGIHELRQQVKNLEGRLEALEASRKKKGAAEKEPR